MGSNQNKQLCSKIICSLMKFVDQHMEGFVYRRERSLYWKWACWITFHCSSLHICNQAFKRRAKQMMWEYSMMQLCIFIYYSCKMNSYPDLQILLTHISVELNPMEAVWNQIKTLKCQHRFPFMRSFALSSKPFVLQNICELSRKYLLPTSKCLENLSPASKFYCSHPRKQPHALRVNFRVTVIQSFTSTDCSFLSHLLFSLICAYRDEFY